LKKIIIIAGPNGAGKTTFARDFLPAEAQTLRFINADLIAAGLAPFNPESASISRVAERVVQGGAQYSRASHSQAVQVGA
jgi:predicted ABC-type ATPase